MLAGLVVIKTSTLLTPSYDSNRIDCGNVCTKEYCKDNFLFIAIWDKQGALVYTAVINGIVAVPILIAIMRIANDKRILRDRINGRISNIIGWTTVMIMGISVVIMFATWGGH